MERVFYHAVGSGFAPPDAPSSKMVFDLLDGFRRLFIQHITRTVPVALKVYPEMNYRGRKLLLYQKARDRVIKEGLGRCPGKLKTFIKHEKILCKNKRLVPRVIQPRSPEYNVCVGRYIRQLEHRVYGIIDRLWGGPTVMKGLNCLQQGKAIANMWTGFAHPVGVMMDAIRFDQHVSVPVLSWEHSIYLEWFHPVYRAELEWLLSMQLFNSGTVRCPDGEIKYSVAGCRASGDMNTAMGNVLIMCAAMYAFIESIGVRARLVNNGDDCCLIVEEADCDKVTSEVCVFFKKLGFLIDVEGVARSINDISFCQTNPVFDGNRWAMVRNPRTAISKDATVLKNWSPHEYAVYLQQLGVAGLAAYGNMPVWASFYNCLARAVTTKKVSAGLVAHVRAPIDDTGLGRLSCGVRVGRNITSSARAHFAMAFKMLPTTQVALEDYYDHMTPGTRTLFPGAAVSHLF